MVVAYVSSEGKLTMFPGSSVALDAIGVGQGAGTGMCSEALTTVTHPRLTEITDGTLKRNYQYRFSSRSQPWKSDSMFVARQQAKSTIQKSAFI